ncbi:unnamed protein product [Closterium sp. Naga37s-1]|nr:unnamed protein product [Closterium sp. Naga37s-1]
MPAVDAGRWLLLQHQLLLVQPARCSPSGEAAKCCCRTTGGAGAAATAECSPMSTGADPPGGAGAVRVNQLPLLQATTAAGQVMLQELLPPCATIRRQVPGAGGRHRCSSGLAPGRQRLLTCGWSPNEGSDVMSKEEHRGSAHAAAAVRQPLQPVVTGADAAVRVMLLQGRVQ